MKNLEHIDHSEQPEGKKVKRILIAGAGFVGKTTTTSNIKELAVVDNEAKPIEKERGFTINAAHIVTGKQSRRDRRKAERNKKKKK